MNKDPKDDAEDEGASAVARREKDTAKIRPESAIHQANLYFQNFRLVPYVEVSAKLTMLPDIRGFSFKRDSARAPESDRA